MEPISNPLLALFIEPDIEVLYRQRDEAVRLITDKFELSRGLVKEIKFNGRFVDKESATRASKQMKTEAERSSFFALIDYFRKGIKNVHSGNKLTTNPLAPSATSEVADSMIAARLLGEMILESFLLHVARFGADVEFD